jgi:hypothetical protein
MASEIPEARIGAGARRDPFGLLDPAEWDLAPALAPLVRAQDGRPPNQTTFVRLAGSASGLHVRFDCVDSEIRCARVRRDSALWEEEAVEIFVAAGGSDPARYAEIEVNPAGAIFDAVVENPDGRRETMRVDPGWDAPGLTARVGHPAPGRWTAELVLPWSALWGRPGPPGVLRANFYRIDRPGGAPAEFTSWSPTFADPPDFHKPERFGRVVVEGGRAEAAPAETRRRR